MPAAPASRLEVTEYSPSYELLPALESAGLARDRAIATLARLSSSLKRQFSFEEDSSPISVEGGAVKVRDLAGILKIAPGVEIDLAPKFLGHLHPGWREDWLAIANLTGEGRVLPGFGVAGSYGQSSDLASLIGRTFVAAFREVERRPLRVYRRSSWSDWVLSGEFDFESTVDLGADGYSQTAVSLDSVNPFNAVVRGAATTLLREVRDAAVRAQVARIRSLIPPQPAPPAALPPVPSRHRRWEPVLELSQRILDAFDVTLRRRQRDEAHAPGLLVRTWRAWERLVFVGLRREWSDQAVLPQRPLPWARREGKPVNVRPDSVVAGNDRLAPLDAKYKTRIDRGRRKISQADLMESAAFADAAGSESVTLLYPRLAAPGRDPLECGACEEFDRVEIGEKEVVGVEVEVRGIGQPGGYAGFSSKLATDLAEISPEIALAVPA